DGRLSVGREQEAQQEFDGCRLAGAIWPQQAEDLALADLQVEGVESHLLLAAPKVPVALGQVPGLDDDLPGGAPGSRLGAVGDGSFGHARGLQRPDRPGATVLVDVTPGPVEGSRKSGERRGIVRTGR